MFLVLRIRRTFRGRAEALGPFERSAGVVVLAMSARKIDLDQTNGKQPVPQKG